MSSVNGGALCAVLIDNCAYYNPSNSKKCNICNDNFVVESDKCAKEVNTSPLAISAILIGAVAIILVVSAVIWVVLSRKSSNKKNHQVGADGKAHIQL